jgi:Zn-finger nucleic acid-binding protein
MDLTCPKCQAALRSYERSGITVDQCTECRGIFLDRGELEKLVDAESSWHEQSAPSAQPAPPRETYQQPSDQQRGYQQPAYQQPAYQQQGGHKPKKRRGFLEELFD